MVTLCIRYTLDIQNLEAFATYAKGLREPVARCGGAYVAYYMPTKIAGPVNEALGFIAFPDLATYERYRERLAADAEGAKLLEDAMAAGCILNEHRSFMQAVHP